MTPWIATATALILGVVPCAWRVLRARRLSDALVALQMTGVLSLLALLVIAAGMQRPSFFDLALALALLSVPSLLAFAHFVERWLR